MNQKVERIVSGCESIHDLIVEEISQRKNETPFYVFDLKGIKRQHHRWLQLLPRIKPFYAVKCNDSPEILALLAELGTGFDCASKSEIDRVLALGVDPGNIIYANPCKTPSHIKHAANLGVNLTTFDNEEELLKISVQNPAAKLVLRIKGDDDSALCKFNIKYGVDLKQCKPLLTLAKDLKLDVVGVSFHNGSGNTDSNSYKKSILFVRQVFDSAHEIGLNFKLIDIGGGFPCCEDGDSKFAEYAAVIDKALSEHFPSVNGATGGENNYVFIAEPGRYYVASCIKLVCMVIGKRVDYCKETGQNRFSYYLNDGVYGAFNNTIFDHVSAEPEYIDTTNVKSHGQMYQTVFWGQTCDSMDCIKQDVMFPELNIGQWLIFKNMGAYTNSAASNFNGFDKASVIIAN